MTLGLLLACAGTEPALDDAADDSAVDDGIERVSCDAPIEGEDWGSTGPAEAGWQEGSLDGIDTSGLADPIDLSALPDVYKAPLSYALRTPLGDELAHADAEGVMGEVVLAAFAEGEGEPFDIDFELFRQGFWRYYTCSTELPVTLDGLKTEYGDFSTWESQDVDSVAKCDTRRLYVSDAMIVAETVLDDGSVRETEILFPDRTGDGAIDFAVYDGDGVLTDRSRFPTVNDGPAVLGASPYVCMTCHLSTETWTYEVLYPEVGPCQ